MEMQRNLNSQNNYEKEEQSWRAKTTLSQKLLKSVSNQNSMVLV